MGCGCNNTTNTNLDYIFQQIYKVEGNCNNKTKKKVFPITTLQSVFDLCSGKYLQEIINSNNHLFIPFQGSEKDTYNAIPKSNRRKGLFITFVDNIGEVKTYHYIGTSLDDEDWKNPLYWKPITENTGSAYDDSDIIHRLELLEQHTPSDNTDLSEVERRLAVLEARPDKDTIYNDTEIKQRLSDLEARPIGGTSFNPKPLEDRITALENKQDNDTIFDPSAILAEIATLKNKVSTLEAKKDENKYVVRGEYLEAESVIRLYYNDTPQTHFDIPFKKPEAPTTKYKILTGYKVDPTGSTPRPTEVDLTNTIETAVLPEEIRIDLQQDDYGYYIFAVDKALLPENYKVQLEAMGMFMDVTEDEMEEKEVNINGRDYVMFIDNSGNMSFTPIRFKIVQL